jgi:hypothetical protein
MDVCGSSFGVEEVTVGSTVGGIGVSVGLGVDSGIVSVVGVDVDEHAPNATNPAKMNSLKVVFVMYNSISHYE